HVVHANSEDSGAAGPDAWVRHCPTHSASVRRRSAGGGRLALPGPPAHARQRLGGGRVEAVGKQPPGALLQTDVRWTQTTRPGASRVRPGDGSDRARDRSRMKEVLRRLLFLLHRAGFERDLDEEMRHHLALGAEERGSPEAARRQFGNVTFLKEQSRAMWTWTFLEQLTQDIRYGLRTMAANPLFTAMAALSLALGIGANTAIYGFMDAILLRSLPVQRPGQLVVINWRAKDRPAVIHGHNGARHRDKAGTTSPNFPFAAFQHLRANHDALSTVFGY